MPYQNISAVLSDADKTDILQSIAAIEAKLPFIVNLSEDERGRIPKMGDKSLPFVDKALSFASSNPTFLPQYIEIDELKKDVELASKLIELNGKLETLSEKVSDTLMAVGSEAYTAALVFYDSVKAASKRNVPGSDSIVAQLKIRFEGQGKRPPKP